MVYSVTNDALFQFSRPYKAICRDWLLTPEVPTKMFTKKFSSILREFFLLQILCIVRLQRLENSSLRNVILKDCQSSQQGVQTFQLSVHICRNTKLYRHEIQINIMFSSYDVERRQANVETQGMTGMELYG